MDFGSLFAGIGGFDLGLERAGMHCKWQVEIDDYATRVLERHWPRVKRWQDIRTFPPDCNDQSEPDGTVNAEKRRGDQGVAGWRVDLICGGFPCQDISYAGRGAGLDSERSGLFWEAMRVVRVLGPRYVLLENVAALLTRGLDAVLGTLAALGYDAEWHCIPAASVGAPHIRDRVFIVAYVADATDKGIRRGQQRQKSSEGAGNVANTTSGGFSVFGGARRQGRHALWGNLQTERQEYECPWTFEPDMGRVAHGVPARVDRLRCLGNAVVPQVAELIGRRIMATTP